MRGNQVNLDLQDNRDNQDFKEQQELQDLQDLQEFQDPQDPQEEQGLWVHQQEEMVEKEQCTCAGGEHLVPVARELS